MSKSVSNSLHKSEETLRVDSSGDGVSLETRILKGSPSSNMKDIAVIITHPYGPLGGNMDNNVVYSVFQAFASLGFMTARFNFRGVGQSTGKTSYQGLGEIEDVLSIYKYIKGRSDLAPKHIILAGYSYGSIAVGAAAAEIPDLIGLICISYPSSVSWALTLWNGRKYADAIKSIKVPKLFMMGDKDNFTSASNFQNFVASLPEPKTALLVKGVDHFWAQSEETLVGHLKLWMHQSLDLAKFVPKRNWTNLQSSSLSPHRSSAPIESPSTGQPDLTAVSLNAFQSPSGSVPTPTHHMRTSSSSCSPGKSTTQSSTTAVNTEADAKRLSLCQDTLAAIDQLGLDDLMTTSLSSDNPSSCDEGHRKEQSPRRPPPPVPTSVKIQSRQEKMDDVQGERKPNDRPTRAPPPIPVQVSSLTSPNATLSE